MHVMIPSYISKTRLRIQSEINIFRFVQVALFIFHVTMKPSKTRAQQNKTRAQRTAERKT